ncbi:ATP synthase F1 subunit gamma [Candidatus Saccharibacteria bacterium CPR2]|nr:ATP synthase F1 subunit gamma [Candidatus Saccharibacteria bacterium CPR2]
MASTQLIKRRIRSVRSTKQITKAMEMVAASKMRRAQEATLKSRAFSTTAREILTNVKTLTDVSKHPLYKKRNVKSKLYILITSDKGLAGAYNANLLKKFTHLLNEDKSNEIGQFVIVIGKKGSRFVSKLAGIKNIGIYEDFPDVPSIDDIKPIVMNTIEMFVNKEIDAVDVLYTHFYSSIKQEAIVQRILPAAFEETELRKDLGDAIFEPSPQAVLDNVTPRLIEAQLHQTFLEAGASEHSMRMLAMKNATDNASELIDDLTLEFNSARQAAITQELAEITGGASAVGA